MLLRKTHSSASAFWGLRFNAPTRLPASACYGKPGCDVSINVVLPALLHACYVFLARACPSLKSSCAFVFAVLPAPVRLAMGFDAVVQ